MKIKDFVEKVKKEDIKMFSEELGYITIDGIQFVVGLNKNGEIRYLNEESRCYGKQTATCPYCGKEQDDMYEIFRMSDGEYEEIECQSCDKTFYAEQSITITYGSYKTEDRTFIDKDKANGEGKRNVEILDKKNF